MSNDFRVTLLGTGVPIPSPDRFGPSTLVEAGDQKFLIDAGRGATIRLYQLNIPIGRIDVQLLTHYHSDHTACLPDVWLTGWLESHFGTRKTPYKVIGPTGAKRLMEISNAPTPTTSRSVSPTRSCRCRALRRTSPSITATVWSMTRTA
jgi:ribonuclease Z